MNDSAWRSTNMKGLDNEALKDPKWSTAATNCTASGATTLANAAGANCYSYDITPDDCNNTAIDCTGYTLTASKEGGGTYTKSALN